jgi:hypothetical protein
MEKNSLREIVMMFFCKHEFQADTQITYIKCKKCGEFHPYEKGVDIFN